VANSKPIPVRIPAEQLDKLPRCPLCGIHLQTDLRIDDSSREAIFTLADAALRHVRKPHTLTRQQTEAIGAGA
jgi:hypothetical protein